MNHENRYDLAPTFGDFTGKTPAASILERFMSIIYGFYTEYGRSMPWRDTNDPYAIFVSEIMLQQTQVSRVLPKYHAFLDRWPTFRALCEAQLREVLALWQGLGYNRRGRALYEAARVVVKRYDGVIPVDEPELLALPGVGKATASAIRSFAYRIPAVYLETNVRRVFIYFFFNGRTRVRDSEIATLAEATLDRGDSRRWNYALMDYGVTLKGRVPNPNMRSVYYARQPPFSGSDRQIRGRILAYLIDTESSDFSELASALPFDEDRLRRCARALVTEGMISEKEHRYFIPDISDDSKSGDSS